MTRHSLSLKGYTTIIEEGKVYTQEKIEGGLRKRKFRENQTLIIREL